jgi:hypothetical protein
MTRVHDRKVAPHPWDVSLDRVAADCQWSHRGLVVSWPGWQMAAESAGGNFTEAHNGTIKGDPIHPYVSPQIAYAIPGGGPRGRTYRNNAGASFLGGPTVAVHESRVPGFPTGPMTAVLHWKKLDTTNRASAALSHRSNVIAGYLFLDLPNGSANVRFFYGGSGAGKELITGGLTFGDDVWVVTVGARGMELWQNGILRNSNASNPTRTAQSDYWGMFGGLGVFGSDFAESGCCLLYNRQLEIPELLELTADPWTPFRPARRVAGRIAAAGTGGYRARLAGIIGG